MNKQRICLVTGATSGIGRATAVEMARMGWTIIVGARNQMKAAKAIEYLQAASGNSSVESAIADFSSLTQVRQMAQQIADRHDRIDVLVNNAGALFFRREISEDGYEQTFAVNHLAPFLLTNLLMPSLLKSNRARIVNVSSGSHLSAQIDFDDLHGEHSYRMLRAYGQSKLANVLFTYELGRRFDGSGIAANAVNPGLVATNMGGNNGWLVRVGVELTKVLRISAEEGAQPIIRLASSPELEDVRGMYFQKLTAERSSAQSYDPDVAQRLWEMSERLVGLDSEL
jgi:NAD(P)-dependent dehydrogenase (short-subunit alcohol dehydrogenase family)